jgi:hypothetical protein
MFEFTFKNRLRIPLTIRALIRYEKNVRTVQSIDNVEIPDFFSEQNWLQVYETVY